MIKTRTDGVRKAKGKYITSIDGDDTFIHKDILKNSLYIAEKGNIDIVEFQKEDPRIILIEHDSNEGPIKSRSDGIRKSRGKYITLVDGDDALIHKDILKNSLYIAEKGNIDVIEFNHAMYNDGRFEQVAKVYYKLNLSNII